MPVYLLVRHRQNLNAPKVQLQLGYIYRIYRYLDMATNTSSHELQGIIWVCM